MWEQSATEQHMELNICCPLHQGRQVNLIIESTMCPLKYINISLFCFKTSPTTALLCAAPALLMFKGDIYKIETPKRKWLKAYKDQHIKAR